MKYHITSLKNERKIRTGKGIDPSCAKGIRKYSWFVDAKDLQWAFIHCQLRHGWKIDDIIAIPVDLPNTMFSEHARQGLFFRKEVTPNTVLGPHIRPDAIVNDDEVDDQWGKMMDAEYDRLHPKK